MFGKKIKIKVNAEEYKLIRDALLNFRYEKYRQLKKKKMKILYIWKYLHFLCSNFLKYVI